jgi:hypothetical protein
MTDEAMSPLRRRMIEDMTIRKLAPKTQQGYLGGLRTPALRARRATIMGPASANLHTNGLIQTKRWLA